MLQHFLENSRFHLDAMHNGIVLGKRCQLVAGKGRRFDQLDDLAGVVIVDVAPNLDQSLVGTSNGPST